MEPFPNKTVLTDLASLMELVDKKGFRDQILNVLSHAAKISNFTVFTLAKKSGNLPKYSFGAGILGDYRLNRNARQLENSTSFPEYINAHIHRTGSLPNSLFRYRPDENEENEIWDMYQKANVLEKLFTTHTQNDVTYYISYYRHIDDGPISDSEMDRLNSLLPIINNILILRHKVIGNSDHSLMIRQGIIKTLSSRKISPFDRISPRETDVCDCISRGLTTEGTALELGISVSTVKTLRHRAYKKMDISSQNELFAMLINFLS